MVSAFPTVEPVQLYRTDVPFIAGDQPVKGTCLWDVSTAAAQAKGRERYEGFPKRSVGALRAAACRRTRLFATLARFASRRVPPGADAGHALVVAFHDLNGRATCTDIRLSRGRRPDVLK
jgi:hypothetical protein